MRNGQILKGIPRTKTQLIEAIEFEWQILPGFTTLTILQEIQMDLERTNKEPQNFEYRIIFMFMFRTLTVRITFTNITPWRKKKVYVQWYRVEKRMMRIASRTLRVSRNTQRCFYQDTGLSVSRFWKRNGTVAHMVDNGTAQPTSWTANKLVQLFNEVGHPIFTATSAFESRNVETE